MIYTLNARQSLNNIKWIILLLFLAIVLILLYSTARATIGILVVTSILVIPQIYLIVQYKKYTNYSSFEIDYKNELFNINKLNEDIQKKISDLKSIEYHKTNVSMGYLSMMLALCEHLYYYRLEFRDGSVYYLTSLLSPSPIIDEKDAFYPYFIKVDRKYARIKRK